MPGDFYYNSVSLLLHGDGADLSTTFTDNSPSPKTVTAVLGAKVSTDAWAGRIGTGSIKLNGAGDYLTVPYNAGFDLPGDFSIEATVYLTAFDASSPFGLCIAANYLAGDANSGWQLRINGTASAYNTVNLYTGVTDLNITGLSFALNTKYAIGVFRTGSTITVCVNGAVVGTWTNSDAMTRSTASELHIGHVNDPSHFYLPGYIDELRITKGVGRQNAAYTPATEAFPDVVEVALMQAVLTAPKPTVAIYTGAQFALTAPKPTLTVYTGMQAALTAPSPQFSSVFGSNIALTGPRPTLSMTGHDATGENAIMVLAPMATLKMHGGMSAKLVAPMQRVLAAMTGVALADFDLVAPMQTVSATGKTSAVMSFGMSAPLPTVAATFGSVISVTGPMGTLTASGKSGAVGRVEVTCPLFELEMTGSARSRMTFDLKAPIPQLGQGSLRVVAAAPMATLVLVGTATVVATYEAYAVNLKHAPGFQGSDELTRYTNYPFDAIVRYQGRYFGVGAAGLYLLEGTTDHASPTPTAIPWDWRTCLTDFDDPSKKTPVSVYIGGRMGPAATVDLIVGETGDQSYSFATPRGATAQNYRQKFGRGVKARYFGLGAAGNGELAIDTLDFTIADLARRI